MGFILSPEGPEWLREPFSLWPVGTVSLEIKWIEHEADQSPPPSAKSRMQGALLPYVLLSA
jgi:hypothetical protein